MRRYRNRRWKRPNHSLPSCPLIIAKCNGFASEKCSWQRILPNAILTLRCIIAPIPDRPSLHGKPAYFVCSARHASVKILGAHARIARQPIGDGVLLIWTPGAARAPGGVSLEWPSAYSKRRKVFSSPPWGILSSWAALVMAVAPIAPNLSFRSRPAVTGRPIQPPMPE